jgi:arylsulfatase A-like enzyme
MKLSALLRYLRHGVLGGALVGCAHLLLISSDGLFASFGATERLWSLARWTGLAALSAGLLSVGLFWPLSSFARRWTHRPPRPFIFAPMLYAALWTAILAHAALTGWSTSRAMPLTVAAAAGIVTLVLLLLCLGLPGGRRDSIRHEGGRAAESMATAGVIAAFALLFFGAGSPPTQETTADPALLEPRLLPELQTRARQHFGQRRRNLLIISIDTLRADHLGCYGYDRDTSPSIDALAARGVLMEQAICPRPTTSPSFASLFTGKYPIAHGVHFTKESFPQENLSLAEVLRDAGYATAAQVTNGNLFPDFGFDQGFDDYGHGHVRAEEGATAALRWMEEKRPVDRPWFFWFHSTDPHAPYVPLPPYDAMFGDRAARNSVERKIDLYDGEIRYTDDHVGAFLRYFYERADLWENTITVFYSDHGESLGEHSYYFQHGELPYETTANIALLFVAPGAIAEARRLDSVVTSADIMPTLLAALGVEAPKDLQGASFLPTLLGLDVQPPRPFVFLEAGFGEHIRMGRTRSLRRGDSKYVERLTRWARIPKGPRSILWSIDALLEDGLRADEYYDLHADPHELNDLFGTDPERDARERSLLQAFAQSLALTRQLRVGEKGELDPQTLESLRSLGYID